MKKNVGTADKVIRIVIVAIIVTLLLTKIIVSVVGIIFLILAVLLLLTSIVGFCPLYSIFGWRSCKKKNTEIDKPQV